MKQIESGRKKHDVDKNPRALVVADDSDMMLDV